MDDNMVLVSFVTWWCNSRISILANDIVEYVCRLGVAKSALD